jgi:aryl-alcohol dehydrogenase-like predicted oxidoreductase
MKQGYGLSDPTRHVDRLTPWEEIWQAMKQPVREGKVIYVGSAGPAADLSALYRESTVSTELARSM